jgi:antitoxin VapB
MKGYIASWRCRSKISRLKHWRGNWRRKIPVTEAIRQSLAREVARERMIPRGDREELRQRLIAIAESAAALPLISDMTDDEILGYDEFGIPSL